MSPRRKRRIAQCAQCGVKQACDALGNPANWVSISLNPPVLCCSRDCAEKWKAANANVMEMASREILARFDGRISTPIPDKYDMTNWR